MGKVFLFDYNRCNGCRNCQIACKDEHVDNDWSPYAAPQPDTGMFWNRIAEQVRGQVPKVQISYTFHICQHCDNAPCMQQSPKAVYKREDGLVIIDPTATEGARDLVGSCPYGMIYYNEERGIAQKCTGCAHLIDAGEIPHCVDVCPHEALRFGEEEDFAAEIASAELLNDDRADDRPRVYYLNKPKRFIGGIVVDIEEDEVVIGAKVTLEDKNSGAVSVEMTDEFGDFWFTRVDASDFRLYVEAEGYLTRVIETSTVVEDKNVGVIEVFSAGAA